MRVRYPCLKRPARLTACPEGRRGERPSRTRLTPSRRFSARTQRLTRGAAVRLPCEVLSNLGVVSEESSAATAITL